MTAPLAIRALRARTPAQAQPVAARLALQALGADLEDAVPPGLPPQALLWLRRLALQAPEAALLRPAPPAWRQDWIAAGRQQLDAALAQAARPALGPVPASAPAVLFADTAEMLGCLALAAQAGQLDRWWWRGLLGRAWPRWPEAWAARPEAQAGAWRLLARSGQAETVARWMATPAGVQPAASGGMAPGRATAGALAAEPDAGPAGVDTPRGRQADAAPAPPAPASCGLAPRRMPGRASTPQDARRPMTREVAPVAQAGPNAAPEPVAPVGPRAAAARVVAARAAEGGWLGADDPVAATESSASPIAPRATRSPAPWEGRNAVVASDAEPVAEPPPEAAAELPPALPATVRAAVSTVRRVAVDEPVSLERSPRIEPATAAAATVPAAPPAAPAEAASVAWPWPQALATRQAPLLFVVNALLEDGLYPDFTRPRDPGLPVPLWALLAALGEAWRLAPDDPLPLALAARCAGWTAPAALPAAPGAAAGPWAAWRAAYARSLRCRLCRRLGWRGSAWARALTLPQPARLWLSEVEWVAEFDLAAHDVAWRLAGLDRDPGWLPSAGCTLRFRFV